MSMLIDWNIKYDIYASLFVLKYCVSTVKMGKSRLSQDYHSADICGTLCGGCLPTHMSGRLGGGGSQLIELTLNYK